MAERSDVVRARIQPALKDEAEAIFRNLGLTHSQAIQIFYHQVTLTRGLPFDVRIPNTTTRQALAEAEDVQSLRRYTSVDALFDELETED
jgi:DNA-damage-inducible protein J